VEDNTSDTTLDGVRIHVARETIRRQDKMKTSMKAFAQMQKRLNENDENLEAMDHAVPLKKLQRRITRKHQVPATIEEERGAEVTDPDTVVLEHEV
jgi:hypothetical protein